MLSVQYLDYEQHIYVVSKWLHFLLKIRYVTVDTGRRLTFDLLSRREWAAAGDGGGRDCQNPIRWRARDGVDRPEQPATACG